MAQGYLLGLPTSILSPLLRSSHLPSGTPTGDFISWAAPGSADPLLLVRREVGPSASARPVLELLGSDMGVAAVWMMRGGNKLLRSSGCSPRDTTAGERQGDPESTQGWPRARGHTPQDRYSQAKCFFLSPSPSRLGEKKSGSDSDLVASP